MKRRVLLIAYYFPPLGLSGVQRVTKFAKYLPDFGWDVSVLTIRPGSYFAFDKSLLGDVDRPGVSVHRTWSADPTRLFGAGSRSMPSDSTRKTAALVSQTLFQPDNKIGWFPFAVRKGRQILKEGSYHAVLSSAPPYSAHLIGSRLSRDSNLPLVVDYRDDWINNPRHDYPTAWHKRRAERHEMSTLRRATSVLAINSRILDRIMSRAAHLEQRPSAHLIPQGFDPEDFPVEKPSTGREGFLCILYAGVFYDAQQPNAFLRGLRRFLDQEPKAADAMRCTFAGLFPRSAARLIAELKLDRYIECVGYLPHERTVALINQADVLWMTVGRQKGEETISTGKLYEYIGSGKPILGLVPGGDARETLEAYGASYIVDPDDVDGVSISLGKIYRQWRDASLPEPDSRFADRFDRRRIASDLATVLDAAATSGPE